jgi:hypothetical protein
MSDSRSSGSPQLDVFRFVVDAEPNPSHGHEPARTPKRRPSLQAVGGGTLVAGARAARSRLAHLWSGFSVGIRQLMRVFTVPPIPKIVGAPATTGRSFPAVSVAVICAFAVAAIAVALVHESPDRRIRGQIARAGRSASSVKELSRAQRIHAQASALVRTAVDRTSTVLPPFNGYLYDLPRSPGFERSWQSMISALPAGVRASNRWLVTLETTATPNEAIETRSGQQYILAWGCDPSNCAGRFAEVAYHVSTRALVTNVCLDGSWRTLGSRSIDDRATVLAQTARERLGVREPFPLRAFDAEKAERFIALSSLE